MEQYNDLETLINNKILPRLISSINTDPPEIKTLIEKNKALGIEDLQSIFKNIESYLSNNNIKFLVDSLWILKLIDLKEIPENCHDYLLNSIFELKQNIGFNPQILIEKIVFMAKSRASQDENKFKILINDYSLLLKIDNVFKFSTAAERAFIAAQAKGFILKSINNEKKIIGNVKKLIRAESFGLFLESTKYILGLQIAKWLRSNEDHKKVTDLQKYMKKINFDKEINDEIDSIFNKNSPLPSNASILTKIKPKYMNTTSNVEVSV